MDHPQIPASFALISTPKKPVIFGSPSAATRPSPHLVFLISTKSTQSTTATILKILLHHHFHIDPQFTWSYLLTSSRTNPRLNYGIDQSAIHKLSQTITETYNNSRLHHRTQREEEQDEGLDLILKSLDMVLSNTCWGTSFIEHQSPLVRAQKNNPQNSPKVRNYIYVMFTPPSTAAQLSSWVTSEHANKESGFRRALGRVWGGFRCKGIWRKVD